MPSGLTSIILLIHVILQVQGSLMWSHYHGHHHTHFTSKYIILKVYILFALYNDAVSC